MDDAIERIIEGLTDAQREAVLHGEGPLLVLAGAGSGKTRVITRRIACLLARGVPPDRIVAITFTNKAADEMRRRVEALVGTGVYVTTFHSFCARMLRREMPRIGREASFTIYDRGDSLRVVRQIVKDMELDASAYPARDLLDYISLCKDRVMAPGDSESRAFGIIEKERALIYGRYEAKLAESNALDFDDLLLKALEVFRTRPDVLADYQNTYLHVLVDEYQDTNLPQHLLARALQGKHRNITAVGDPDQMIYTWRGARLENLLEFEEDFPGAHLVKLERNYRSTTNILRAASGCIRHNRLRHEKELWSKREPGDAIVVREFLDAYAEGRWVADKASELIQAGTRPGQIAVFYRTKQQSLPLEDAFAAVALPHQVVDNVGFFDRRAVKDLRAYLQLLLNPRDDVACLRVINTPPRGIGAKTLGLVQAAAQASKRSVLQAVRDAGQIDALSNRARKALLGFWSLYEELGRSVDAPVAKLLERLLSLTDYVKRHPPEERSDVQEVTDMFLGYARQYDERSPEGGLMGFLEQAALVSDVDGWNAQAEAVPFMTLHSAKGLEFDVVFLVGAEEDILPHRRALDEGVHGSEDAALEEERRLFYVGMTRARDRLFITHSRRRTMQGRETMSAPSRFLDELPEDCIERTRAHDPAQMRSAQGFAREMEYVLKKKRSALKILDGGSGDRLAKGVRVEHPQYGEGVIHQITPMGKRMMVRVDFFQHGMMALLLASADVGEA